MTSPDDGHGHDQPPADPATEEAVAALAILLLLLLSTPATLALLGAAGVLGTAAQVIGAVVSVAGGRSVVSRPAGIDYRDEAVKVLVRLGINRGAAEWAIDTYANRPFPTPGRGMVSLEQAEQAPTWRARFVINTGRRLDEAARDARRDARAAGEDPTEAARAAQERQAEREARYFQQHLDAEQRRQDGAAWLDAAAATWGPRLVWWAVIDKATTPECLAAHGHWFDLTGNRPRIGLPGTGPHDRCRCIPAPPGWLRCPSGWSVNQVLALPPSAWPTHHHF